MKAYTEYKLDKALEEWSKCEKSLGEVAKEQNISVWEVMDLLKKKNIYSPIKAEDLNFEKDFDF
ncbi:MAG: hypothetical protein V1824_02020 [archaeon]